MLCVVCESRFGDNHLGHGVDVCDLCLLSSDLPITPDRVIHGGPEVIMPGGRCQGRFQADLQYHGDGYTEEEGDDWDFTEVLGVVEDIDAYEFSFSDSVRL